MLPFFGEQYFNPSSAYSASAPVKEAINKAALQVAAAIGADPSEIYFTSCATESNNWVFRLLRDGDHFITTRIEHASVLNTAKQLEKNGFSVTWLGVDAEGRVSPDELRAAIKENTKLVSVMYTNNETGVVQPINELAAICKEKGIVFHTDAVQAVGNVEINVKEQNINLLSLTGHKFHAPKGVGVLYLQKGIFVPNLLFGGEQGRGKRAGTENVANVVGLGQALEDAVAEMQEKNAALAEIRELLLAGVMQIPKVRFNGSHHHNMPHILNFSFAGVEGEGILLHLAMNNICCSSGSACTSGSLEPSHVLMAMGLDHVLAQGSLRVSLSKYNTKQEVVYFLEILKQTITKLRQMSPIWQAD
jgi:cysteine desulfurase